MRFEIIISYLDYYIIERVIELRAKSKPYIGQVTLAHKIGVSEGYMGKIDNPKEHAKYNIRMLGRVAIVLGLKSYKDLFPDKVYEHDLVRVIYEESKSYSNKHKPDKTGKIQRKYKSISVTPLSEKEIEQWKKEGKPYLKKIKE
ncbi:hypothetical protein [Flavivirga jejuensis]|uniref:HTH cro/C1-type domain-containing protein n=1 Tax=Flavivirga jejuensis TaxID=870487 RepID=A0ABT8WVM5_9FLAO|nr:hypothetical protein [Flavivirga jejuensis]MDO5977237.1 hypothetical protein [Flavivirga jejuensis]